MEEKHFTVAEYLCQKAFSEKFNVDLFSGEPDIRPMSKNDFIDFYLQAWNLFNKLKPYLEGKPNYYNIALYLLCSSKANEMQRNFYALTKNESKRKIKKIYKRNYLYCVI